MTIESPDDLFERLQKDIFRQGYSEIAFSMSQQELEEAEQRYLQFLTLPAAEKEKFEIWIPGLHRDNPSKGTRFGYKDESRDEGQGDNKEYFHHGHFLRKGLAAIIRVSPQEVKYFIEAADDVLAAVERAMEPVYEAFDTKVSGFAESFNQTPYIFLRFLSYKPVSKGEELAIGHFDRGALTLAMYENRDGLEICPATHDDFHGKTNAERKDKLERVLRRLQPVSHSPDSAFLFASDAISSIMADKEGYLTQFPKGYHRVDEKHPEGEPHERRTAIVAFISPKEGVVIGDWNSRHPSAR